MSKLTFNLMDLELGLVTPSKRIGRATLYKVNLENPIIRMLVEYERQLSLQISEKEKAKAQKPAPLSTTR